MNNTDLALFLTKCSGYYRDQRHLRLVPPLQSAAVAELAAPDLLSVKAIAAIVGCSEGAVRRAWPLDQSMTKHRGHLNPNYLSYIAYLLSGTRLPPVMVNELLSECAPAMVARLTNISDDTLQRWRKA